MGLRGIGANMSQHTFEQEVFASLPGTAAEIIEKTGACRATVCLWLKRLCDNGLIHIKFWRRTDGQSAPYYVAGEGVNAPKIKARTGAEYSRRHYKKHRRDLDKELRASLKAARLNAASTLAKPQSWLSALGAV